MTNDNQLLHAAACFLDAADVLVADGLCTAREDDPHRFQSLHREFDEGLARRRLVVDFLPAGRVRIATELHGLKGGNEFSVEVSAIVVQGPIDAKEAH